MKRNSLAAAVFVLSALAVMGIGWWTRSSLPVSRQVGKSLGQAIFLLGMAGFVWTVAYLRGGFFGEVTPVLERLVKDGPYRRVRHPLYLSMIIMLLGMGLAFRSLWGVVGVFVFFLPSVVFRARLEEQALAEKFGETWGVYTARTCFLLPWIW